MKTEKFEDKIRKKLESIEPEFHENEWLKFNEYSNAKLASTANVFSSTLYKIAASVAIIGTVFISISQYKNNIELEKKIETLTAQNETLSSQQKQFENYLNNKKPSQLYDDKQTTDELKNNENKNDYAENNSNTTNEISNKNQNNINGNILKANDETFKANQKQSKFISDKLIDNELIAITNSNKKIIGKSDFYFAKKQAKQKSSNLIFENYRGKKQKNSISDNIGMEANGSTIQPNYQEFSNENLISLNNKSDKLETNYNLLISKGFKIDSTKKFQKHLKKSDFAYYKPVGKQKMHLTLADAYLRTGLNSSFSRGTLGYGITTELFLDQRISLSAGLNKMQHTSETIIKNGSMPPNRNSFNDKYRNKIPPTREIMHSIEKTELVMVPIRINYNHPIKSDFKIIGSLGTDLDLNGKENIDYEYKSITGFSPFQPGYLSGNEKGNLNNELKTQLFNNIYVGIGAEKQFGKIGLQAKVYDSFQIKDLAYRNANRLGAEIGLFYRL